MSAPWERDWEKPLAAPWERDWKSDAPPAKAEAAPVDTEAALRAQRNRGITSLLPFGQYLPDVAMGARQVLDAGAQMAARATGLGVKETEAANQKALDDYKASFQPQNIPGTDIARGMGQGLVTSAALPLKAATTLAGTLAQGAGLGGASAALTPDYAPSDDFWKQKGKTTAMGAGLGAATGGTLNLAGRALSPKLSAETRTMLDADINVLPGQAAGGMLKSAEEKIASIPGLGDAIKGSQRKGIEDFNRAIYSRTLAPLGDDATKFAKTLPAGNEGVRKVGDYLSTAYESALAKSVPNVVDQGFVGSISTLGARVPKALQDDFRSIIKTEVVEKITQAGTLTPSVAKSAESALGSAARGYMGSASESERQLGRALLQAQAEIRALVAKNNPEIAPTIQAINNGWSHLTQLENAAARVGAKNGIFTPAQYLAAIKQSDGSIRDRAFARGMVKNQDFAQAADKVLSNKYPDSGTTGRGIMAALMGGGLGMLNPAALVGAGVTALPYLPGGRQITSAMLGKRPEFLSLLGDKLKDAAPYLGAVAPAGLLGR